MNHFSPILIFPVERTMSTDRGSIHPSNEQGPRPSWDPGPADRLAAYRRSGLSASGRSAGIVFGLAGLLRLLERLYQLVGGAGTETHHEARRRRTQVR
jgi:hypothetical protein